MSSFRFRLCCGLVLLTLCTCNSNKLLHPADSAFSSHAPEQFKVLLETTKGDILLELKRAWAPYGVDRFYNLVRHGYYDDAAVFRVRARTWAQLVSQVTP